MEFLSCLQLPLRNGLATTKFSNINLSNEFTPIVVVGTYTIRVIELELIQLYKIKLCGYF